MTGWKRAAWAAVGVLMAWALAGCTHDDTPMALKIINGETDRLLYARTILRAAADAPNRKSALEEEQIESIEFAWSQSQHAYGEILRCQDDGVCRMRSMVSVCEDVTALLAARRTLAAEVDLLSVSEMLSADKGPLNADRLRLLKAEAARDGKISPLEEDVLTLATAVSVAHGIWSLTPEGEKERLRRRKTHAVDEFKQRCDAHAL